MKNIVKWMLIIIVVSGVISFFIPKITPAPAKPYASLTEAEKREWLNEVYSSNVKVSVRNAVKDETKFPKTVDFEMDAFGQPYLKDLENRELLVKGKFSAKNAFGVESDHLAEVVVSFTDSTHSIESVKIY